MNPQEAHETWLEWQKMTMEMGQLKMAMGAALLPITRDLMPDVVKMFQGMVQFIKDNKEAIVDLGQAIVSAMGVAKDMIADVADMLDSAGINAKNFRDVMTDIKAINKAGQGRTLFSSALVGAGVGAAAGSFLPGPGTVVGALAGAGLGLYGSYEILSSSNAAKKQKQLILDEEQKKKKPKKNKGNGKVPDNTAAILAEQKKAAEEAAKANKELEESLYSLTHSDLDNSLHAVDVEMKKYKERGASEIEIARVTEAKKAKILKQFNEDVAQSIDSIWKSELQNRLDSIDREKEAWKQKGLDEVKSG